MMWLRDVSGHLFKKETIAPAIFATIISAITTPIVTGLINRHNAEVHDQADAKRQAIRRFEVESEAFGGFVAVFVLDVARDNKANQQAFERLATNLASQKAALDDLLPRLPPILHTEAIEYEKALLAFNAAMAKVSDVESMREFWERNSDLQVARRNLLPQLIILDG